MDAVDANMQDLVKMKKLFMGLLIFSVVTLVLNIALIVLATYLEYKKVISVVNQYAD